MSPLESKLSRTSGFLPWGFSRGFCQHPCVGWCKWTGGGEKRHSLSACRRVHIFTVYGFATLTSCSDVTVMSGTSCPRIRVSLKVTPDTVVHLTHHCDITGDITGDITYVKVHIWVSLLWWRSLMSSIYITGQMAKTRPISVWLDLQTGISIYGHKRDSVSVTSQWSQSVMSELQTHSVKSGSPDITVTSAHDVRMTNP